MNPLLRDPNRERCGFCGAPAGEACRLPDGRPTPGGTHALFPIRRLTVELLIREMAPSRRPNRKGPMEHMTAQTDSERQSLQQRLHVWKHRKWPAETFDGPRQPDLRRGQTCRVLARGRNGNMLVEFEDGTRIVGVRYCAVPL